MAKVKKVVSTPEPAYAAGQVGHWEKASDRGFGGGPIHFPESTGGTDTGSRSMPEPAPVSRHLSGDQFAGNPYAGLQANLQQHYLSGAGNNPGEASHMVAYRASLRKASLGSAGSSQHSLGAALSASGGSMYGNEPMLGGSSSGGGTATKKGVVARFLGGDRTPGGKRFRLKASPHAGKNAAHLKAATGAK